MASRIAVLDIENLGKQANATTAVVKVPVSTGRGTEKHQKTTVEVSVPRTLEDAIKIEGKDGVFKRYIGALVVAIQAEKRKELGDTTGEKKERKRAGYLEELGL